MEAEEEPKRECFNEEPSAEAVLVEEEGASNAAALAPSNVFLDPTGKWSLARVDWYCLKRLT